LLHLKATSEAELGIKFRIDFKVMVKMGKEKNSEKNGK
jgi:hypothetical protein